MKTNISSLFFALFLTLYSCKEDVVPETDYPFIVLSDIKNMDSDGAAVSANILNLGDQVVQDYGFVWNSDALTKPTLRDKKISFGKNATTGAFSDTIPDLVPWKIYYVRAYVKTNILTVYSNSCWFKFK